MVRKRDKRRKGEEIEMEREIGTSTEDHYRVAIYDMKLFVAIYITLRHF